jgi:ABC-2 family transporter
MTAITSGRVTIPAWRVMRAAWFRNRMTLTVLLAVFAAAAGWTLYEAGSMRSWLIAHHVQQCITPVNGTSSACQSAPAWEQFIYGDGFHAEYVIFVLLGAPVVLAMFGGVRWLTREYETGSFLYTWTLGVSRIRWLAGTLLPLLAVVMAGAVACGLAYDRWFPAAQWLAGSVPSGVPWEWNEFPLTPLTFTAFVLAGFGIAACAAALIRRTVPAMAATAAAAAAGAYLADTRLRTWLITLHPVTARAQYGSSPAGWPPGWRDGDYLLRGWVTDHAGHIAPGFLITHDGGMMISGKLGTVLTTGSVASQRAWLAAHHYTYWISYQPHTRLLIFQAAWAGTLLAVAIAAFGLTIWRVTASR